jgi:hypothetical protein
MVWSSISGLMIITAFTTTSVPIRESQDKTCGKIMKMQLRNNKFKMNL